MRRSNIVFAIVVLSVVSCTTSRQDNTVQIKPELIPVSASASSAEPFLFNDDGKIYLSWVEKTDSGATLKLSQFENTNWTEPTTIAQGKTWFVNWADYPMLASKGQNMIAHFLDMNGDSKYAYDVKLTYSSDNGKTWSDPNILNDDKKQAEHGFATLLPYGDNFFITWLDGRNTAMEGMEGMDHHEGHHGSMSLRAAIVDYSGKKIKEWELDNKTCDCCQTSAAITPNGPVVIYRDRSNDEIRDMSIVRLVNDEWTQPQAIHNDNWKIAGCPVNGPRSASKNNSLAIAWFSAASDATKVNIIFSDNAGESFGKAIRIDEGNSIGRVDIDLIDENTALVTWMEGAEIKIAKVKSDGAKEFSATLASSSKGRSSGFPQLAISGNHAIVAWTDDNEKTIKTAFINL